MQATTNPTLLSHYAALPPWPVAGVDFPVGCTGDKLQIPSATNLPPGAQWYNGAVNFIYGGTPVVTGWDFTGVPVTINVDSADDVAAVTFEHCRFNLSPSNLCIPLTIYTSAKVLVSECDFDGKKIATSVTNWAMVRAQPTNPLGQQNTVNLIVQKCRFLGLPDHGIDFSSSGKLIFTQNYVEGVGFAPGNHADIVQFYGGQSDGSKITLNTIILASDQACFGEGIQVEAQGGGTVTNFTVAQNVIIFQPPTNGQKNSYCIALHFDAGQPQELSGTVTQNYMDWTGGYGPFYTPVPPGAVFSGNVNMVTGASVSP